MNKSIFSITILLVSVIIVIGTFFISKKIFLPFKVHYHAGFVVFQNNKKMDFSDNKYMYFKSCNLKDEHDDSTADIQLERAHLHENIGDLVHVEASGAYWKDLFKNIGFSVDEASLTGFINGKEVANFLEQPIRPYESLVVFIGDNDPKLLNQAVTKDYILTMAKQSTTCGD